MIAPLLDQDELLVGLERVLTDARETARLRAELATMTAECDRYQQLAAELGTRVISERIPADDCFSLTVKVAGELVVAARSKQMLASSIAEGVYKDLCAAWEAR